MSDEEEADAGTKCRWCDGSHEWLKCDRVKAFGFDAHGAITRVEFLTPADYAPPSKPDPVEPDYPRKGPRVA